MFERDMNGIPEGFVARHEILSIGERDNALVLITNGEVSEQRRQTLEFICNRNIILESLDDHPDLHDCFHETVTEAKAVLAAQPTRLSESAEDFLKRLEEDPNAQCDCPVG